MDFTHVLAKYEQIDHFPSLRLKFGCLLGWLVAIGDRVDQVAGDRIGQSWCHL